MRITITVGDSLMESVDEQCKEMNLSRSAFITLALNNQLKEQKAIDVLQQTIKVMSEKKTV